jgi:hypothetical protein
MKFGPWKARREFFFEMNYTIAASVSKAIPRIYLNFFFSPPPVQEERRRGEDGIRFMVDLQIEISVRARKNFALTSQC